LIDTNVQDQNACLACLCIHHFGWNYGGGTVADGKGGILRRGRWIPMMTAAGWWKGKFRGKAPAVPGRPPKGLTNHTATSTEPSRYFIFTCTPPKGKWQHNLTL